MAVDFIRAVDVNLQSVHGIRIEHRDTQCQQSLSAGHRARHRAFDLVFHRRQCINEFIDGGSSPDADKFAGYYILECSLADPSFEFILRQCGLGSGCGAWHR